MSAKCSRLWKNFVIHCIFWIDKSVYYDIIKEVTERILDNREVTL